MRRLTTASASNKAAPKGGRKKSMHIRQADNGGYVSETHHDGEMESETNVHDGLPKLVKHVKATFAGGEADGDD